jgi:CheY-like chemotaxis protein
MKEKLNCVLLIDDDEPTNFYNEMIVEETGCSKRIVAVTGGREALDFLKSKVNGEHPQPNLIFLDINMPGMSGWEFLEEYEKLTDDQKGQVIVVMLTTSFNPDDQKKAENIESINDFKNKPLNTDTITEILEKHFPDLL